VKAIADATYGHYETNGASPLSGHQAPRFDYFGA